MDALREAVIRLYTQLGETSEEHSELADTDVREALHETLNYYFVWAKPIDRLPLCYAMFTQQGDEAVAAAVRNFLETARPLADAQGIAPGAARLAVLQDETIEIANGEQYDMYIGHADQPLQPEPLHPQRFEPGDYDD